jgi:hypothetical protein
MGKRRTNFELMQRIIDLKKQGCDTAAIMKRLDVTASFVAQSTPALFAKRWKDYHERQKPEFKISKKQYPPSKGLTKKEHQRIADLYAVGHSPQQIADQTELAYRLVMQAIISVGQKQRTQWQGRNIFTAIDRYGDDDGFTPMHTPDFYPTDAPAGSWEKVEVLRQRVELGQPLWHEADRVDYEGISGGVVVLG